jgi:hypothetical protein
MKQKKKGFIPVKQMTRRFNGINGAGKGKSRFNPGETPVKQQQQRFHGAGGAGGFHGLRVFGFLLLREKFRTYGKASESLPQRQAKTQI